MGVIPRSQSWTAATPGSPPTCRNVQSPLLDTIRFGHCVRMPEAREGALWDVVEGRAPLPKASELLGWSLHSIDTGAGTIVVRFEAREAFTNPVGNIHGGFLAAMLDDTMGPALVATLPPGQFAPTLEMKISFFQPAKVGVLWGHGRVVSRGRSIAFVEADLTDDGGRLVARASATARIIAMDTGKPTEPR